MPTESTSVSSVGAAPFDDFDPQAQVTDAWGIRYPSFKAFLLGHPFEDDRCNQNLALLRAQGRSQAFCKAFREGYDRGPKATEPFSRPDYRHGDSAEGWRWAEKEGLVSSGTATWRSVSRHNVAVGLGYDNARRAAESAPAG